LKRFTCLFALLALAVAGPAAGVEKGSQQVSPFHGSFSYAIPIEVPRFRGLEPPLALSYSSEGRNGLAGVGWTLSGFGLVERVNAGGGTPTYTASDTYVLEGQKLVACVSGSASPSCTSGGTHSTQVESFRKIRFDAAANTWTVWAKDGTRTIYTPIHDVSGFGTLRWGQTSVVDTKSNTVTYSWTCPAGACMPAAIQYNSHRVDLFYENRSDVSQSTGVTAILQNPYRIRSIFVWLPGVGHIRAYRLSYTTSPVSGRSLLAAVQQYGKDVTHDGAGLISGGTTLPPTTFAYQNDALARSFVTQEAAPPTPAGTVEPVVWTNRIRVYAWEAGNSLYKESGGQGWNAGAASTRSIGSGDGYVEATAGTGHVMVGLSNGDSGQGHDDIDFAVFAAGGASLYASENGVLTGPFPLHVGDVLRVEVQAGVVRYKRNGAVVHTSGRAPTYPLTVDSSIHDPAGVIHDVKISGALQQSSHWCPLPDRLLTGDFNGDGFTDQLCGRGAAGPTQVALGTATGFQPPAVWLSGSTAAGPVTVSDFNGDGKADLSFYNNWDGLFHVSLSTGTAFEPHTLWGVAAAVGPGGAPYHCKQHPAQTGVGDFNGDGRLDVSCRVLGHPEAFIGLNTGTSFVFSIFAQPTCGMYETTGNMDFDGDGKDDWYCMGMTGSEPFLVFTSTGSSFASSPFGSLTSSFCSYDGYVLGDFNGDGRTDASCRHNGKVALSTGRTWVEWGHAGAWCVSGSAFAADVDGDGTSEMICNNPGAGADDIQVRKWLHSALGPAETWRAGWCEGQTLGGDFNGDGKSDLLCTTQAAVAVGGTAGVQADLATTVTTPLGGTLQAAYAPSTGGPAAQPANGPPTKQVVASFTTDDGRGGATTTAYRYFGGYMDRTERRFMGFRVVDEVRPCLPGEAPCPYKRIYLRQDLAAASQPEYVQHYVQDLGPTRQQWYEYQTQTTQGVSTATLTGEWDVTHDLAGCTTWPCPSRQTYTTHVYDALGNRTQTVRHGDSAASGDEFTDVWTFRPNTSSYVVDKVARHQRLAGMGLGGAKLTEMLFHYDGAGAWDAPPAQGYLTQVRRWLDQGNRYLSWTLGYDGWGNLTSYTDETNRSTTLTYEPAYHVYPDSVTNGAGEREATAWDPLCGVPAQAADANGQLTAFATDALCRPSRTDFPLGAFEITEYLNLGDPGTQSVRVRTPSAASAGGDHWTAEYLDGLGRVYERQAQGPTAAQTIRERTTYNARGSVASHTAPFYATETAHPTTYAYDGLDRLTTTRLPDGHQVERAYGPWRITYRDEHGHETTEHFDGHGQKRRSERLLSGQTLTTTYAYDLLGRMTGMTDALGNQWRWDFDSLGRNYRKNDPDAGVWTLEYDDADRLWAQTDAKAQRTDYRYDAAGRLATKTTPDEAVTFVHSQARSGYFNVGRLTSVTSGITSQTLDYDARGRNVSKVRSLDGNTYSLQRRYDSAGRLRGITFPDGDAVGTPADPWRYDAAGRLIHIPQVLSMALYDASGRPLGQANANGSGTTRTYSAERGFLTGIKTVTNTAILQDLVYNPDPAGLVIDVTSPFPHEGWKYGYDDLHRLTEASNVSDATQSQTWSYDEIGRITYNSRIGAYTYPPAHSPRPHAPISVAGGAYHYDANGNLYSGGGRSISWNASNQPTSVSGATFTYDGLGERLKKVAAGSTTTYPFGDDYEVRNGTVTKYISAPGLGIVAKRTGGKTFWLHKDRLGSIQALTDQHGVEVQRRTYRPYGDKIADRTGHVESRGYIEQRQDGETGLTYLHARYYDSSLGLFVSPDPLDPTRPGVGPNRYMYALGDPISGADPGGLENCSVKDDVVVCEEVIVVTTDRPSPHQIPTPEFPGGPQRPPGAPGPDEDYSQPGPDNGGDPSGDPSPDNTEPTDPKTPTPTPVPTEPPSRPRPPKKASGNADRLAPLFDPKKVDRTDLLLAGNVGTRLGALSFGYWVGNQTDKHLFPYVNTRVAYGLCAANPSIRGCTRR
jgi:RHS repeat-associated protein